MTGAVLIFITCLLGQDPAAPAPSAGGATGPVWIRPVQPEPAPARFVFAFFPGLTAGLSPIPSGDLAFFFGRRLHNRPWALGYQLTLSTGWADRYAWSFATHRHHFTAQRTFGARERGFAGVGGGLALLAVFPVIEAEGRVGLRFGKRQRGVFGGLARLGWNVTFGELAPTPQLGLFLGISTL